MQFIQKVLNKDAKFYQSGIHFILRQFFAFFIFTLYFFKFNKKLTQTDYEKVFYLCILIEFYGNWMFKEVCEDDFDSKEEYDQAISLTKALGCECK